MTEIREDMLKVKRMITDVEIILGKREGETELVNKLIDAENLLTYCMSRLENAIVPPCKVGDTVYVIEKCSCYETYANECSKRKTSATKYLKRVRLQDRIHARHTVRCLKLFARPFKINMLNNFGKTLFFTREEAEKALAERQGSQ